MANRKFTDEEVLDIRFEVRGGADQEELAEAYECSRQTIGRIARGKVYANVTSNKPGCQPFSLRKAQNKRKNSLTPQQVEEIKERYAFYKENARAADELKKKNPDNQLALAYKYGVSQLTISQIVNGKFITRKELKKKEGERKDRKHEEKVKEDEELKDQIRDLLEENPNISNRYLAQELGDGVGRRRTKRLREEIEEDTE